MKKVKVFGAAITLIAMSGSMYAQEQGDSTKKLDEVTVTATRSEKNIFDAGRSVTVIHNTDLKNGLNNNLADVLSQQEGIYMVGAGQNLGGTQSLFMRGAGSNQSVIMLDGVRITDPSAVNNSPDFSEFSLTNIDKIEIVRGSHSTMYGSSAIGGVVNIITRKNMDPGFHVDAEAKGGIYGKGAAMNGQELFLNYTFKKGFYIDGEVNSISSSGQDATVDTVTDPNTYNERDADGFSKLDYVGKVGFRNGAWDVYAGYRGTNMKTDIDKRAYIGDDNYTLDFKRSLISYGASYKFNEKISMSYVGGLSDMSRYAKDDSSVVDTSGNTDHTYYDATYSGKHSTNELQMNLHVKGLDLMIGSGVYMESMSQESYYYSRSSFGVYESKTNLDSLQLQTTTFNIFTHADLNGILVSEKAKAFSLGLGLRYSDHSTFGSNTTFEIDPSFKISDNSLLYASYSTGYNAPSLYQLYAPDKYYTDTTITRGNKDLKPETSSSFELGFKQKVNENTSFTVALFSTEVKNTIEYVYLWDKNVGIDTLGNDWMRDDYRGDSYINVGTSKTKGVEFSVNSKLSDKFSINANISLVSGRLNYDPSEIDTAHTHGNHVQLYSSGAFMQDKEVEVIGLTRRPSTANVSLSWKPFKSLLVRPSVHYVGARSDIYYESTLGPYGALATAPVGDYMLIDLFVQYAFTKNISAGVKCENLLDTEFYEINGFTTRGRGVYINLRAAF